MGIGHKRNKRLLLCYMSEIGHKYDNVSKCYKGWANIVISFTTPTRGSLNIDDINTVKIAGFFKVKINFHQGAFSGKL